MAIGGIPEHQHGLGLPENSGQAQNPGRFQILVGLVETNPVEKHPLSGAPGDEDHEGDHGSGDLKTTARRRSLRPNGDPGNRLAKLFGGGKDRGRRFSTSPDEACSNNSET